MSLNLFGLVVGALAVVVFALIYSVARHWGWRARLGLAAIAVLTALPAASFSIYYAHLLPEPAGYYEFRSWRGVELVLLALGLAGGSIAAVLPRMLLILPLVGTIVFAVVPFIKPLLAPLSEDRGGESWKGDVCLQSTTSTCGPASSATVLRALGVEATENEILQGAFTSATGTEAWYLARHLRRRGLDVNFHLTDRFDPDAAFPAVVGVKVGAGHFIAVLGIEDGIVSLGDPLVGPQKMPLQTFLNHYQFTGFHMEVGAGEGASAY